jgi:hypothetical protein
MSEIRYDGKSVPFPPTPVGMWSNGSLLNFGIANNLPEVPEELIKSMKISLDEGLAKVVKIHLTPKKVIFREDSKTTIVIWRDDSKTVVRCSPDEKFIPEFGLAMATMKRLYGGRGKFLKILEKVAYYQDEKEVKVALPKPTRVTVKATVKK